LTAELKTVFWREKTKAGQGCQMVYFQTENPNFIFHTQRCVLILGWATIWAIFSQTRLITLTTTLQS
jgi:hypothetical protein